MSPSLPHATQPRALMLVLILVLAGFWDLWLHPTDLLVGFQRRGYNDVTDSIIAQRAFLTDSDESFQISEWNRFSLIGATYIGNPQTAWLYPLNWLYAVLPAERAISWVFVLHQVIAAAGTYCLLQFYRRSTWGSAFGALSYGLAPYLIANIGEGHYNPICSTAWFPWLWLSFEHLRSGRAGQWLWIAGLISLCFFCGHQQETFYLVLLMTAAVAIDAISDIRSGRTETGLSRLAIWVGTGVITLGLVAKDLLPVAVYTRNAVRATGLSAADAGRGGIPLYNFLQLVAPWAWGNPESYAVPGYPEGNYLWENFTYFGVATAGLALLGILSKTTTASARRWGWIVGITLVFGLGSSTPFYGLIHNLVPGVSFFRAPCRALFITSLGVAILAAHGVDSLLAPLTRRLRNGVFGIAGSLALLSLIAAIVLQVTQGDIVVDAPRGLFEALTRSSAPLFWLGAVALALTGFSLVRTARARGLLMASLVALTSVELIDTATRLLATIDSQSIRQTSPAIEFLAKSAGHHRIMSRQVLLSDREAWAHGLFKLQGYEPVPSLPVAETFFAASRLPNPLEAIGGFHQLDLRTWRLNVLDLIGARYILLQLNQPRPELLGWKLVWSGKIPPQFLQRGQSSTDIPVAIYENPQVLPRAYVLGTTAVVPRGVRPADLVRVADPRKAVIVAQDLLPKGPRQRFAPAEIVSYRGSQVVISARLDQPGYLVLTDAHAPGWTARLDSAPNRPLLPIQSVYTGLRGVPLPAGEHRVSMSYQPPGLAIGSMISVITGLIAIAIWWLAPRLSARRSGNSPTDEVGSLSETRHDTEVAIAV